MSKAIDDLKHEHEAILSALKILDQMIANIDNGSSPGRDGISGFIGFLKEFGGQVPSWEGRGHAISGPY